MTLLERLGALITAMKTETKTLRVMISGANNGNVSGLTTTATDLVAAINEVKATADNAGGAGAEINDLAAGGGTTYSSNKITADIAAAKTAVKNEILNGAAAEVDTLMEIATLLASNDDTDAALAAVVANKANASDVYTQAQLGNPDTDLVALWNAA
ncbi:hypothetical protein DXH95_03185 [Sphingorhabdus pulchriflava]|uniref:Uncharacterized protein n=1 Tax=Sphingorhabdus pulchriflava TaxID=2292257 RepID=A0A371BFR2_9SPHN|nr:hypothetical protein [Sphingorhabdus pulchriflava]RDV06445.1 hypothetical protein DXH95_03185 [Sphingorhabdus pulchriflava]